MKPRSVQPRWLVILIVLCLLPAVVMLAKGIIPTPPEEPVLGELEPVLIEALSDEDSPDASLATVCDRPEIRAQIAKHDLQLFGGPVLGCVTDRGAKFWVRTGAEAEVQVIVGTGVDLADPVRSKTVRTAKAVDLTAILEVDGLQPLTEYHYDVTVDGTSAMKGKRPPF
ncbi:MAG: PhoD-like phosphatase N-terminal domain-containing protein, partial [Planctomycetes bacterium]|nr:PhoD-like phosphatase N-terminal domain-containing protein [Planctomycetota bacterium]